MRISQLCVRYIRLWKYLIVQKTERYCLKQTWLFLLLTYEEDHGNLSELADILAVISEVTRSLIVGYAHV